MKSVFETIGYSPTNVHFSPIICNLLAVSSSSTSNTFTSPGKSGALFVLDHFIEDISSPLKCFRTFYWPGHELNDVSWSESNDNILWTVSSDGLIQVWDLNSYLQSDDPLSEFDPSPDPVQVIKGHTCTITSIDWLKSASDTSSVLTSSCDTTIKLWDSSTGSLIDTFPSPSNSNCSNCIPNGCGLRPVIQPLRSDCFETVCSIPASFCPLHVVTQVKWSPLKPHTFAASVSDGAVRIYSTKTPNHQPLIELKPSDKMSGSNNSLTSCDWGRHDENLIVIGTSEGSISGIDVRSIKGSLPLFNFTGHRKSVNKVTCDPHRPSTFSSVSSDSTIKIWDFCQSSDILMDTTPSQPSVQYLSPDPSSVNNLHPNLDLITTFEHHTDHVTGFSFNSSIKDQVVDCSKESLVYLYSIGNSRKPSTSSSPNSSTISTSSSLDSVRSPFDT